MLNLSNLEVILSYQKQKEICCKIEMYFGEKG